MDSATGECEMEKKLRLASKFNKMLYVGGGTAVYGILFLMQRIARTALEGDKSQIRSGLMMWISSSETALGRAFGKGVDEGSGLIPLFVSSSPKT